MRIISLLPSATEIVCVLGLSEQLVGISADSDSPSEVVRRLPVLNTFDVDADHLSSAEIDAAASGGHQGASLYHVDQELLRDLRPDLILTQEICEVCAVSRRDVELATSALGYRPEILSLSPVNLDQVLEDVERVATTADVGERGKQVAASLRQRIASVAQRAAGLVRPSVFCMEWLDPPWTAGHWVPGMVDLAGGSERLGTPGGPSRKIAWQEIVDDAPEVVVLMPCSLELERVAAEFHLVHELPGWSELPAVRAGRVFAGDTHLFSRSGPRLVDGLETLARMLHPDVFTEALPAGRALKVSSDGTRLVAFR